MQLFQCQIIVFVRLDILRALASQNFQLLTDGVNKLLHFVTLLEISMERAAMLSVHELTHYSLVAE